MHEYTTQAVILDKEPFRDYDSRVSFFTEKFGKLVGKAVSTRKIKSKLAAHLEPGNLVHLRFVEKHGLQIVDSVKTRRIQAAQPELFALSQILGEGEPDAELWSLLKNSAFSWQSALRVLGWNPAGADCRECGKVSAAFHLPHQEMYCRTCASKLPVSQVIYF